MKLSPQLMVNIKRAACSAIAGFYGLAIFVGGWTGLQAIAPLSVRAVALEAPYIVATAEDMSENVKKAQDRAKEALDELAGEGTSQQIEGQVDRAMGTATKQAGKAEAEFNGTMQQIEGKAKQDTGKLQRAMDRAGERVEEMSESIQEAVQKLVGQE